MSRDFFPQHPIGFAFTWVGMFVLGGAFVSILVSFLTFITYDRGDMNSDGKVDMVDVSILQAQVGAQNND